MSDLDPKKILYSIPTIAETTPAVEAVARPVNCRCLHEDDWRQIEFVPRANVAHIEKELQSLTASKRQHQRGPGWTNVYVRREHPSPLSRIGLRLTDVSQFSQSVLWLGSGPPWGGLVKGGFALSDTTHWFMYGQRMGDGKVLQLGISQYASEPSMPLAEAVARMTASFTLLVVDWYANSIVDTSTPEAIFAWSRRYRN